MVEFGDEFIIETYKIPWLIWIQLLVTILLILFLFFGFAAFNSDPSSSSSSTSSAVDPPSNARNAAAPPHPDNPTSSNPIIKVENVRARRDEGNPEREEDETGDGSSLKNSEFQGIFRHPNHPCNYFGLAKQAIFKCFGLDSSSNNHEHEKHE